jgi:hypothetical protein
MSDEADERRGWLSPLRVGRSFFTRKRAVVGPADGIMSSLDALSRPGVDTSLVHPAVRAFFEQTSLLELYVVARWAWPFVPGAKLVRWVATWVGQLRMPMADARILTRTTELDAGVDGREGARGCIRTYGADGPVMQVVSYAVTAGETPTLDAVFPGPIGALLGRLRLDPVGDDGAAVALVSTAVTLTLLGLTLPLPFRERLALWDRESAGVPPDIDGDAMVGATLLGEHEQWVFGVKLVRYRYWFRPMKPPPPRRSGPTSSRR